MRNNILKIFLCMSLIHNVQILSSQHGQSDNQLETATSAENCWSQELTYKYIEKPFWLTGDTLHERKVIHSSCTDIIDYPDNGRKIFYKHRIRVHSNYCYFSWGDPNLFRHVNRNDYLRIPDNIETSEKILTKNEYKTLLAAAIQLKQEHPEDSNFDYPIN